MNDSNPKKTAKGGKENNDKKRTRRPAFISRMTIRQKQTLVSKAIELAEEGDFSGVSAMALVEANQLKRRET